MANADPFSVSTMLNSLHHLCFVSTTESTNPTPLPRGIPITIPPPRNDCHPLIDSFPGGFFNPRDLVLRLQSMFNLMTNSEEEDDTASFKEMISKMGRRELRRMASLLTSNSSYFLEIARNKNGSNRLKKLIRKSDDVDNLLFAAILRRFLYVMTDKHASYVAIRGMRVFDEKKKESMYEHILHHALQLARDKHGCTALNEIITDLDHPFYKNQFLDIVVQNALS